MKSIIKTLGLGLTCLCATAVMAQDDNTNTKKVNPRDGIYERISIAERPTLTYAPLREADVVREHSIWREIDICEKQNQHFRYPKQYFIDLMQKLSDENKIALYSSDDFSQAMTTLEKQSLWSKADTITNYDVDDFTPNTKIVYNEINPDDIKKFRVKEVWFFDEQRSTMSVRILGIAPILTKFDNMGNALFNYPMCWMYYPEARQYLTHFDAFTSDNDRSSLSWEDVFEMHFFNSTLTKASDITDKALSMRYDDNRTRLLEAEKIHTSIFNLEQSVWQY